MSAPDLRLLEPDDDAALAAWSEVTTLAFAQPRPDRTELAWRRRRYAGHRLRGAFVDGRIVGTTRTFDTRLTVPGGAAVPADAVSGVTVLPTHRRRGVLTAMLRADLAEARERGAATAVLIASEAPIYGRFGFGPATEHASWDVDPAAAAFRAERTGTLAVVAPEDLRAAAPDVYARARRSQPGALDRPGPWWDLLLGLDPGPGGVDRARRAVLHRDEDGVPDGLLLFRVESSWHQRAPRSVLVVDELLAADERAYAALWRFCCEVDLVATVRAHDRRVEEDLPWLLEDPRAARRSGQTDFLWLRVLDPAALLTARAYLVPGRVVLEVADPAGHAHGRWALEVAPDGSAACTPTGAPADVTLPVAALGSLVLGGGDAARLARTGWLREHRPGAAARLGAVLLWPEVPWCSQWF